MTGGWYREDLVTACVVLVVVGGSRLCAAICTWKAALHLLNSSVG